MLTLQSVLTAPPVEFIITRSPCHRGFTVEFRGYTSTPANSRRYAPQVFASFNAAMRYGVRTVEGG